MPLFDKAVESLLQEAIARGEFDNLKNKGKKLNLTDYFSTPEELRVASSVLKNAGVRPPEVELLREIAELKTQLASCQDNAKQAETSAEPCRSIRERIGYLQIEFNIAMERIRQQRRKNQ